MLTLLQYTIIIAIYQCFLPMFHSGGLYVI